MADPSGLPGWSPLAGIPMPTQVVCHPADEDRMRAAMAADPIWGLVELVVNDAVGRGVLILVDQRATAVYGEPLPPAYEYVAAERRFCCDTAPGCEHLRHCPFAYRPIEVVGPVRYGQCDATCTSDCGHCKGQGLPCTCPEDETGRLATYTCVRGTEPHAFDCPRWGTPVQGPGDGE